MIFRGLAAPTRRAASACLAVAPSEFLGDDDGDVARAASWSRSSCVDGRVRAGRRHRARDPGRAGAAGDGLHRPGDATGLLEQLGVELDARGNVARDGVVHDRRVAGVFVAGDAGRGQSLIVWAIAEGRACRRRGRRATSTGETSLPSPDPADRRGRSSSEPLRPDARSERLVMTIHDG